MEWLLRGVETDTQLLGSASFGLQRGWRLEGGGMGVECGGVTCVTACVHICVLRAGEGQVGSWLKCHVFSTPFLQRMNVVHGRMGGWPSYLLDVGPTGEQGAC